MPTETLTVFGYTVCSRSRYAETQPKSELRELTIMSEINALVQTAQSSDVSSRKAAFDTLMMRYQAMAYKVALQTLRDPHLAEDAVQEAFITAYLQIGQLREPSAFGGWLKRIVMTHCDRMIRGKRPQLEPLELRYDLATEHPGPEALVEEREINSQVQYAISVLPEHERAVTEGYYLQGESQKELAERLELPLTTVKKRLQYARQHLRLLIGELNAAVDQAIADILHPPQPERQPAYLYLHQEENVAPEE